MNKKIRFLSLIAALAIGATASLTACGKGGVAEHDHVYDEGKITTGSTCHSEGVKTYSCTVEGCKQTKTEPVAMLAHTWNDGEVTTPPSCSKDGVKTYTCTVAGCGKKKEVAVDKSDHRFDGGKMTQTPDFLTKGKKTVVCLDCKTEKSETVEAHADFSEQFYTSAAENNNWHYGYMSGTEMSADNFVQLEQNENGVWKAEGIEIGNGYVSGNNAAVAYRFDYEIPEKIQTGIAVEFKGEESNTCLNACLVIINNAGTVKKQVELNTENGKDWSYKTEEAIDIAQADTVFLILKNSGTGKAGGNLAFTLTAPCVHVWDSGKVTKKATCEEDGVIEYGCVSCDEKITDTVNKIPHDYEGVVTTEPTEDHAGLMTYTCKLCNEASYTQSIPRLVPFTGANFGENFASTLAGENTGWEVGVVNYVYDTETFDFTKITDKNGAGDAFNDNTDGWKEIKGDWMASNGMTGFAYHFYTNANVNVNFTLQSSAADGKFALRWAVKDINGNIKNENGKAQWGMEGHDIEFNRQISVENGDVLYLLVGKVGNGGDQCGFGITLTKAVSEEYQKIADFGENFASALAGNNTGWKVGGVSYDFPTETFTFTQITTKNDANDAFKNADPFMEINGGWMASNGMTGLAYTFGEAANIKFNFSVECKEDGLCAVRWAVKDSAGNIKTNGGKASWGGSGKTVTLSENITVEAGDVLYILIGYEWAPEGQPERNNQKDFTFIIEKKVH